MSAENVELVRRLNPQPGQDLAATLRGDAAEAIVGWLARFLHPDCEVMIEMGGVGQVQARSGAPGLRDAWLEWMAPWATYRTEIERMIDLDDRVLVLIRDYGRYEPEGLEVQLTGGAIWTVRDEKVVRAEFYVDRDAALRAAGMAD